MTPHERFNQIVEAQSDGVYGLCSAILKNPADAADITQETFIRLWKHLPEIHFPAVRGWLLRTARNQCLDRLRGRKTIVPISEDSVDHASFELEDTHPDPAASALSSSIQEEIMEAVERMPETWRSPFLLKELHGCSCQEIAEICDYPLNSVKVYLMRARRFLRSQLQDLNPSKSA